MPKLDASPRRKKHGCEYCGRTLQPRDAVNCCGCGAPLDGLTYQAIDVTTISDPYPTYLYVPQAKPCQK